MSDNCDVEIFGLATMGANLARNSARRGCKVAAYNRHVERTDQLIKRFGGKGTGLDHALAGPVTRCNQFSVVNDRSRVTRVGRLSRYWGLQSHCANKAGRRVGQQRWIGAVFAARDGVALIVASQPVPEPPPFEFAGDRLATSAVVAPQFVNRIRFDWRATA
jgi:hypothetical protein